MDIASTFSLPTAPVEAQSAEQLAKRGQIEKTARDFEASFLSVMLGQMFKDVGAQAPFSSGHGEAAFKSFLGDAMAKQMVQHGGVGLADRVTQEMLKLQGLS